MKNQRELLEQTTEHVSRKIRILIHYISLIALNRTISFFELQSR
jgi:hypothetical protein